MDDYRAFHVIAETFSSFTSRTNPQRRIIILLNDRSAHGSAESLPRLWNVDYQFLPLNTTCELQLFYAGVIAAVKMRYWVNQYDYALDSIDTRAAVIYKISTYCYAVDTRLLGLYKSSNCEELLASCRSIGASRDGLAGFYDRSSRDKWQHTNRSRFQWS